MARIRLSTTAKVVLCVTVPVLLDTCFFFSILDQLSKLERNLQAESKAVDALVLVDGVQTGTMQACAALAMFKTVHEKSFLVESQLAFSNVEDDCRSLRELAKSSDSNSALNDFIKSMDEIDNLVASNPEFTTTSTFSASSVSLIGNIRSCVTRIKRSADKTMEQLLVYRKEKHEEQKADRERISSLLQIAAVTNGLLAAIGAIAFSMTLGRKFNRLTDNTVRLSINKPLNPVLKGNDELAVLDQVIHNLADELALTRQKERAILDNTAEIICTLDDSLRVAEITPAVEKRLGYTPDEFRGSTFQSHVHPDDRANAHKDLLLCKTARDEISFETRIKGKDEVYRYMELTAKWSENDKTIFCIARDITARKEAERLKAEVIAMVSHDLRAPLTALGLTLEMILEGIAGAINEQGTKMVTVARQSVVSLITMINDLLDMERFEATGIQLHYEKFDVQPIVEQSVSMLQPESDSKALTVRANCEAQTIEGDNERLNRVITNLLNNAIKFSPSGGSLNIDCRTISNGTGASQWQFEITDEGPGIPADKIDVVFEKFRQAGTGSEGEKVGSGLGLAICKSIIEAHGGTIGVRSTVGKGSTFWFKVPTEKGGAAT